MIYLSTDQRLLLNPYFMNTSLKECLNLIIVVYPSEKFKDADITLSKGEIERSF